MVRWICGIKLQYRFPSKGLRERLWVCEWVWVCVRMCVCEWWICHLLPFSNHFPAAPLQLFSAFTHSWKQLLRISGMHFFQARCLSCLQKTEGRSLEETHWLETMSWLYSFFIYCSIRFTSALMPVSLLLMFNIVADHCIYIIQNPQATTFLTRLATKQVNVSNNNNKTSIKRAL